MSLFEELKRRNVVRVGIAYAILGWFLAQLGELMFETFGAPPWVMQVFVSVLVLGLPIALFFAWAFEVTPEGIKRESEVDRSESITHVTGRKLDRMIIGVLVLAVAYFAIDKFFLAQPAPQVAAEDATEVTETEASEDRSIAVLPFVNMSDDEANEYFSDGLSEELLNVLAKNPELQVAARTSSFSLRDERLDATEVGARLNVAHVLEGSVRKAGNRVRITAQLIRADNGYHLWSDTFDRDLDDIFAIQDEIAGRITEALLPHIVGGMDSSAAPASMYTPTADAYQRFLLARDHLNRQTQVDNGRAYEIMSELVREYPDYPEAQALFAHATFKHSARMGGDLPWVTAEPQARLALERATNLDPNIAEAYLVEGRLHTRSRNPGEAIPFFERAIELNPSYAEAYQYLSEARMQIGETALGWEALETARRLDPISVSTLSWAVTQATEYGNEELADESMGLLRQVAPETADDVQLHIYIEQDRPAEAAIAIENFRRDWPDATSHDEWLARQYADLGMFEEAGALDPFTKAMVAAGQGNRDVALSVMEEHAAQRTDPHDRADVYWNVYLQLDMHDEALQILSDLWYGYAAEEMGPRMDVLDTWVLIMLLREAGRHDEAAPIAEHYRDRLEIFGEDFETSLLALDGRFDEVMEMRFERLERGDYPVRFGFIPGFFFMYEDHPNFPELVARTQEWQEEQRALYDELSDAGR